MTTLGFPGIASWEDQPWVDCSHRGSGSPCAYAGGGQAFNRVLTCDNTLLSQLTIEAPADEQGEGLIELEPSGAIVVLQLIAETRRLARSRDTSRPASPRARLYRADLDHFFEAWGHNPSNRYQVAGYLADHVRVLKVATLTRQLAAISVRPLRIAVHIFCPRER